MARSNILSIKSRKIQEKKSKEQKKPVEDTFPFRSHVPLPSVFNSSRFKCNRQIPQRLGFQELVELSPDVKMVDLSLRTEIWEFGAEK